MPTSAPASWRKGSLFPALSPAESLDIYDIRSATSDIRLAVTTLAGLINRGPAKVYLVKGSTDEFWLQEIDPALPRHKNTLEMSSVLEHLLHLYRDTPKGLIIYDPALPTTINVATTLAGLRDAFVVSPTQASSLQEEPYHLPVLADLRVHAWKNALQAYAWAYQHLLPECSSRLVAGLDPDVPDYLRSFLVAHRVFTYWLDARNILPHPTQGLLCERTLLKRILAHFPPGSLHLGWFVNEPLGVRLTSHAALLTLASDYCTNLEIWTTLQAPTLPGELAPAEKTLIEEAISALESRSLESISTAESESTQSIGALEAESEPLEALSLLENGVSEEENIRSVSAEDRPQTTYLSFIFSDGDNLQYCQNRLLQLWNDPARGSLPIGWTIAPALQQVMPLQAAFYRRTASENDELIAGPSGVAYILPSHFPRAQREAFLRLTAECMQTMNLNLMQVLDSGTLFSMKMINFSLQEFFIEQLASTDLRGIFSGWGNDYPSWVVHPGSLVYQNLGNLGLPLDVPHIVHLIERAATRGNRFINIYLFAWNTTPTDLQAIVKQLGEKFYVVKPGRLLELIEEQHR